jgi:hypothetical protein
MRQWGAGFSIQAANQHAARSTQQGHGLGWWIGQDCPRTFSWRIMFIAVRTMPPSDWWHWMRTLIVSNGCPVTTPAAPAVTSH